MPLVATFNQLLKIGLERDYGTAPSGTRLGRAWWEGGRWHSVITDGLPTIQDNQAIIFPAGYGGDRRINQQPAVQGRAWSEGELNAPIVADYIGVLLAAAMGGTSTNMVPSFSAPSLTTPVASRIENTVARGFTLNNQPTNGGNIVRVEITGSSGGTLAAVIGISGIDSYGNGASEIITYASEGNLVYSRTSWSSIGAGGLAVSFTTGGGGASFTSLGIQHFVHTFTTASVSPTIAFERVNNPTAGEASANLAFIHPGMMIRELTLESDAEAADGIFMARASFEGMPTGSSAETSVHAPSPLKIWPTWGLQVTRDLGTTWNNVANISTNINTGGRNYRSAAGVRNPQGVFSGAVEATGDIRIHLQNELEFKKWSNASEIQMLSNYTSPWDMGVSNMQLACSLPAYFETLSTEENDNAWSLTGNYRVVRNDNFPFSFQLVNSCPGTAYDGTGV